MQGEALPKTYKLNNGHEIPLVGIGTFKQQDKTSLELAINEAGYTHIDTATLYENEEMIGEVLQAAFAKGKKREDFFITTKLWHTDYKDTEAAIKSSLKKLQIDQLDLYLIHFPVSNFSTPKKPIHEIWKELESFVDKGYTKSIGLSNFNTQLTCDLLSYARIKPVCNQIELNPQNAQLEHVRFLLDNQILPVAYAPTSRGGADYTEAKKAADLREEQFIKDLGAKYNKSPVQVMLNWGLRRGHCVIPKASSLGHLKENIELFDFKLTDEEVEQINEKYNKGIRLFNHIGHFNNYDFWS